LSFQSILYEVNKGAAVITLNRPERLNALSLDVRQELGDALQQAGEDDDVRCLVLTGSGRAFCAGGDLGGPGRANTPLEALQSPRRFTIADEALGSFGKPVIGAINGHCFGGGMMLALKCDILLAAESAQLGLPQMRQGSAPVVDLLWLVGPQWARYMNFTGDSLSGRKAKEIGLVMEVFPDDQLLDKAVKLAQRIAATPASAVQWARRAIDGSLEMMGLHQAQALNAMARAITSALAPSAETRDGQNLRELMRKDIHAFLAARDAPYREPWP
jgi:enoyl-CoA hydratase/carnithine racemase